MAKDSSFDIVSKFDPQELSNALDQARRELSFRYDFKNSPHEIVLEKEHIIITAEDDYKMKAIIDILVNKVVSRKLDSRILDLSTENEKAGANKVRKKINIIQGLSKEKAKEISKLINTNFKKAKVSVQGEEVRVSSSSRDVLQEVINFLKEKDLKIPLQFINYR